jgi:catechol 2,3-dioxygenase-like lactoylglutathione lyase family enzyme
MSGRMITALDHIAIQVADLRVAAQTMARLFARDAAMGEENAVFELENVRLELLPAEGDAEGLAGLAFEIADADKAFRTVERRALNPRPPVAFAETDPAGTKREGRYIELDEGATFGVPIKLLAYGRQRGTPRGQINDAAVTGLDHVVIRTTHPNRAASLYGARLGLDMRLDRTEPKWSSRLMFFRCGDLIVEVVHDLKHEASDAPDRLWGLSWRVADADAANARLKANGVDVSEVRLGRKPGTRVFTVRDGTLGVPTLMVEPSSPKH